MDWSDFPFNFALARAVYHERLSWMYSDIFHAFLLKSFIISVLWFSVCQTYVLKMLSDTWSFNNMQNLNAL